MNIILEKYLFSYIRMSNHLKCLNKSFFSAPIYFNSSSQKNLICFRFWDVGQITKIINIAKCMRSAKQIESQQLKKKRITILMECKEDPVKILSIYNSVNMIGANCVTIQGYSFIKTEFMATVYSALSDMLFVSAKTHRCVEQFIDMSDVPVICVRSRVHQPILALATILTIMDEKKSLEGLNISFIGPPTQILNSLICICSMLNINLTYMCYCDGKGVSPLLLDLAKKKWTDSKKTIKECVQKVELFSDCDVVISGPSTKGVVQPLTLRKEDLDNNKRDWIYMHMLPRESEVEDSLFFHKNARTLEVLRNMQYIIAALISHALID